MMNWILLIMGTLVAVVAAVIVGGLLSPRVHRVVRGIRLSVPPDDAWPVVVQVEGPPRWCPTLPNMRVVESEDAVRLRLDVLDDNDAVVGQWQLALLPLDATGLMPRDADTPAVATLLVITEVADIGNPALRLIRSVGRGTGRVDGFLEAAAAQLGVTDLATDVSLQVQQLVSASRARQAGD